jgi:hypothetical protein
MPITSPFRPVRSNRAGAVASEFPGEVEDAPDWADGVWVMRSLGVV